MIDAQGISGPRVYRHSFPLRYLFSRDDRGESRIYQGVTTELAGQCVVPPSIPARRSTWAHTGFADAAVQDYASASPLVRFWKRYSGTEKEWVPI